MHKTRSFAASARTMGKIGYTFTTFVPIYIYYIPTTSAWNTHTHINVLYILLLSCRLPERKEGDSVKNKIKINIFIYIYTHTYICPVDLHCRVLLCTPFMVFFFFFLAQTLFPQRSYIIELPP